MRSVLPRCLREGASRRRPMGICGMSCWFAFFGATAVFTAPLRTEPLRGTVVAADGSPAAGAVVWAAKIAQGPLERREVIADAKGRYTIDLEPGSWCVWARHGTQGG